MVHFFNVYPFFGLATAISFAFFGIYIEVPYTETRSLLSFKLYFSSTLPLLLLVALVTLTTLSLIS